MVEGDFTALPDGLVILPDPGSPEAGDDRAGPDGAKRLGGFAARHRVGIAPERLEQIGDGSVPWHRPENICALMAQGGAGVGLKPFAKDERRAVCA